MTTQTNYEIDETTGETFAIQPFVPHQTTNLDKYVASIPTGGLPIHVHMAHSLPGNDFASKLATLATYTDADVITAKEASGRVINVCGAAVIEHGGYNGQDGEWHQEGYKYIVLRTDEMKESKIIEGEKVIKVETPVIIKTSAVQIVDFFLGVMAIQGWFDWPTSIRCYFSAGGANNAQTVKMLPPAKPTQASK